MATITTAQAGNWSDTTTWTGGVLPGSSDTAALNHVVTLDQDINVTTLSQSGAGGLRVDGAEDYTVSCSNTLTMVASSLRSLIILESSYSGKLIVNVANSVLLGDFSISGATIYLFDVRGGDLEITAPTWRPKNSGGGIIGLIRVNSSFSTILMNGDIVEGNSPAVSLEGSSCNLTINGNITPKSAYGIQISGSNNTVVVNGNLQSGFTPSGNVIYNTASASNTDITINGNVTAGNLTAIYNVGPNASILVVGDVRGGTSSNSIAGIQSSTNSSIRIQGKALGTVVGRPVVMSAGTLTITGDLVFSNSVNSAIELTGSARAIFEGSVIKGTGQSTVVVDGRGRPVIIGKDGQETEVSGFSFPIDAAWMPASGSTVKIVRPSDAYWPLLTGDPVSYVLAGKTVLGSEELPNNNPPPIADVAYVVGAQISAAMSPLPPGI